MMKYCKILCLQIISKSIVFCILTSQHFQYLSILASCKALVKAYNFETSRRWKRRRQTDKNFAKSGSQSCRRLCPAAKKIVMHYYLDSMQSIEVSLFTPYQSCSKYQKQGPVLIWQSFWWQLIKMSMIELKIEIERKTF